MSEHAAGADHVMPVPDGIVKVTGTQGPLPGDEDDAGVALLNTDTEGDGEADCEGIEGDGVADAALVRDDTSDCDGAVDAEGEPDIDDTSDADDAAVMVSDPPPATHCSVTLPLAPLAPAAPPAAPTAYDAAPPADSAHELPPPPGPIKQ